MKVYRNDQSQYHRTDGPAIILSSGYKAWYLNDKLHRSGGPAITYSDGSESWYLNGKRHRTDGPAIYSDESEEYWINDIRITEEQFNDKKALALLLITC